MSKASNIVWRHEYRRSSNHFAQGRNITCNNRTSACHRFDYRQAKAFIHGRLNQCHSGLIEDNKICCLEVWDPRNAFLDAKAAREIRQRDTLSFPLHEHESPRTWDIAGECR